MPGGTARLRIGCRDMIKKAWGRSASRRIPFTVGMFCTLSPIQFTTDKE